MLEKASHFIDRAERLGLPLSQGWLVLLIAGAIYYQPNFVVVHRTLCLLFIASYELLVLAMIPILWTTRLAHQVWTQEFEEPAVRIIARKIRSIISGYFLGTSSDYSRLVVLEQEVYNTRGLGLIAPNTLMLNEVFVELRISDLENVIDLPLDPIARREFTSAKSIWDFIRVFESNLNRKKGLARRLFETLFPRRRMASKRQNLSVLALAVVGPPGCGKSTLLQHVSIALANQQHGKYGIANYTPILLMLREHVEEVRVNANISISTLTHNRYLKKYGNDEDGKRKVPSAAWLSNRLLKGKCLILLDGLDEVADDVDRRRMSNWVERQMVVYPDSLFIVTSRPRGYVTAPLKAAQVVEVQPFTEKQVTQFVEGWYLANEAASSGGKADEGVRFRAKQLSTKFLLRMSKKKALKDLSVNPLLLTMITLAHRYRGALPESRLELYKEICAVLLGRWDLEKRQDDKPSIASSSELSASQKLAILMPLAARMMQIERLTIPLTEVREVIEPVLSRMVAHTLDFMDALKELQVGTALLQEREPGYWGFCHLTFQEYLTASYWCSGGGVPYDWTRLVAQSWWHETLRLYAAQADATSILVACLDVGSLAALTLADEIMDERPHEVREDVRSAVLQRIQESLEANDLAERRFAAEVRLSKRLNSLCSIDENTSIDLAYISCAEYQLFLDEMCTQGKFLPPDHWDRLSFARGFAREPITGVRASDAEAFCDWLGSKYGTQARYRLPLPGEATKYYPGVDSIGTWCKHDGEYKMILSSESLKTQTEIWMAQTESKAIPKLEEITYGGDLAQAMISSATLIDDLARIMTLALAEAEREVVERKRAEFDVAWSRSRVATISRDSRLLASYLELIKALASSICFLEERLPDQHLDSKDPLFAFVFGFAARMPAFISSERTEIQVRVQRLASTVSFFKETLVRLVGATSQERAAFKTETNEMINEILYLLMTHSKGAPVEYASLLKVLLCVIQESATRNAVRNLILHVFEYSYAQHELMADKGSDRWHVSNRTRKELSARKEDKQKIQNAYWRQTIIVNRQKGQLGSWEGVRIVKEVATETPAQRVTDDPLPIIDENRLTQEV